MFKALAELVMRSRFAAIVIAFLGIPLLSQVVLGLVTLRKGWQEGLLILLWASLPTFIGLWLGGVSSPMALASIAMLSVGYFASSVLRVSISWPVTLIFIAAISMLSSFCVILQIGDFEQYISVFLAELEVASSDEVPKSVKEWVAGLSIEEFGGAIAYSVGSVSLIVTLIARWWQSLLYNPGGFQKELHYVRLPVAIALVSAGAWVYCSMLGESYAFWALLCAMPLWVGGLSLAHWIIARYKLGVPAIIGIYVLVPMIPIGVMILMLLAMLDAGLDLRSKIKIDQSPKG